MLYEENPIKFIFQEESALGSSDECLTDLAECKTCKDSDGDLWYEVELPFDDKGFQHYLSLLFGVNRTAQEKGWVKAGDTTLNSPLNWPGFKLTKEERGDTKDARIDYKNLTPFFKELFEDIDLNGNGRIGAFEVKNAVKEDDSGWLKIQFEDLSESGSFSLVLHKELDGSSPVVFFTNVKIDDMPSLFQFDDLIMSESPISELLSNELAQAAAEQEAWLKQIAK